MTRSELLQGAVSRLAESGIADPHRDARVLLRWASGLSAAAFSASLRDSPPQAEADTFERAIAQRLTRIPVSHITGERLFWGRSFVTGPDVLDPRPETETLVAEALRRPTPRRIVDLGTGSGCLLVSLLCEWPEATGVGIDCSEKALAIARQNLRRHELCERAVALKGDWLRGQTGPFDMIVANPPYLAEAEIGLLEPEVREHEPRIALTPGGDGLDAYRAIAADAPGVLGQGGWLLVEIGPTQAEAVRGIFEAAGLRTGNPVPDMDGRDRVICARN